MLHRFIEEVLPGDVSVQRIADQAKVVGDSVHSFLRDLFVSMAIIIAVMMILFPLRSALVAAITIPLSTFISVGVMYLCGIPLNTVTLAALIVVLGMIVDNSIVVIDGYLDYLGRGHSRWYAAVESAREVLPVAAAGHRLHLHDLLPAALHHVGHIPRLPELLPLDGYDQPDGIASARRAGDPLPRGTHHSRRAAPQEGRYR